MAIFVTGSFLPPNSTHPQAANSVRVGGVRHPILAALLMGVVIAVSAVDQALASDETTVEGPPPIPNPTQGQLNGGAFITLGAWLSQHGVTSPSDVRWPKGPDNTPVSADFIWGPNTPGADPTDTSSPWVWRPAPQPQ